MRDKNKFCKLKSNVPYQYFCMRCRKGAGEIYLHGEESVCYKCLNDKEKKNIIIYKRGE